ncbi:MAG: hypothetical protein Q7S84_00695 [bacterium]|nr:hypothetical protein [bacterium]
MKYQLTTLVLGEVSREMRGTIFQMKTLRSAPHYFEVSVPHQVMVGEERHTIDGREVVFDLKGYPPDILLIQTTTEVPDIFSEDIFTLEEQIYNQCREILERHGGNRRFSEMYSIFEVAGYKGDPEQFMPHASRMASLLKSERVELDPREVEYTLATQIKYARHDLAIIDWDGAFLFDIEGVFAPTVELLTLANVQLLRHRITDRRLDEHLERMASLVKTMPKKLSIFRPTAKEIDRQLEEIVRYRMLAIQAFQTVEREIKLIGDWYSARIFDIAARKFKILEWRDSIKEKLEFIEDIYTIVVENFGLSRKDRAEFAQIIFFFILQIGWLALIILEFIYFTR